MVDTLHLSGRVNLAVLLATIGETVTYDQLCILQMSIARFRR